MADVSLFSAFLAGIISFLSPCVLPLVPGYLSLMSGVSVAAATSRAQMLRATLLFVAGFTVVFTAFGAGASAIGQTLIEHQRELTRIAGVVVIVMGLVIAGLFTPLALMRERRFHVDVERFGAVAAPVMGMAFAFGWTPCIGPILSVVLSTAATSDTLGQGVVLLVAYSLGLGVPFVAAGLALERLTGVFGWVKRHIRVLNLVAGAVLVSFGVLLVTNQLGWLSGVISDGLDAVGLDRLLTV